MDKSQRDRADHFRNREKRLAQMKARMDKLRAAGMCAQCGLPKADYSASRCEGCLAIVRELMKNKRTKNNERQKHE